MAYNWTKKRIEKQIKYYNRLIKEVKHSGENATHLEKELEEFKSARGVK